MGRRKIPIFPTKPPTLPEGHKRYDVGVKKPGLQSITWFKVVAVDESTATKMARERLLHMPGFNLYAGPLEVKQ